MVKSKAKGNQFERKIANLLSERFAAHTGIDKSFRRAVDSGSFFGGTNRSRMQTHDLSKATFGDIVTPDDFLFNIECKHYKLPPTLTALMKQEWKTLDGWIEQAEQDAENSGKAVLIIMKFNNVDEIAVVKAGSVPEFTMNYKGYVFLPLAKFLELDNSHFF